MKIPLLTNWNCQSSNKPSIRHWLIPTALSPSKHINSLEQGLGNSIANAQELPQPCTKPSINNDLIPAVLSPFSGKPSCRPWIPVEWRWEWGARSEYGTPGRGFCWGSLDGRYGCPPARRYNAAGPAPNETRSCPPGKQQQQIRLTHSFLGDVDAILNV